MTDNLTKLNYLLLMLKFLPDDIRRLIQDASRVDVDVLEKRVYNRFFQTWADYCDQIGDLSFEEYLENEH